MAALIQGVYDSINVGMAFFPVSNKMRFSDSYMWYYSCDPDNSNPVSFLDWGHDVVNV